jgi:hypothetical protein
MLYIAAPLRRLVSVLAEMGAQQPLAVLDQTKNKSFSYTPFPTS